MRAFGGHRNLCLSSPSLAEHDLNFIRSEAYAHYGNVHTELCTDFLIESVTRAGHNELSSTDGIGNVEFVSSLEEAEYPR